MPWLLVSPGHQQPWYWLCKLGRFLSYMWRNDKNYKCMFMFLLKKLARKKWNAVWLLLTQAKEHHHWYCLFTMGWNWNIILPTVSWWHVFFLYDSFQDLIIMKQSVEQPFHISMEFIAGHLCWFFKVRYQTQIMQMKIITEISLIYNEWPNYIIQSSVGNCGHITKTFLKVYINFDRSTHCGLLMLFCNIELGQHWIR